METAGRIRREEDRLSSLADGVLGHVLSFLPAKEAARAAALSARWRDVYAGVHAVSLEEPERPIPSYNDCSPYCRCGDPNPAQPFSTVVTASLVARHRRQDRPAPPPLTALRVALDRYRCEDTSVVDHWISYALKQAAAPAGLELDLRLRREDVYSRVHHSLRYRGAASLKEKDDSPSRSPAGNIPDVGEAEHPQRSRDLASARSGWSGASDPVLDSDEEVASNGSSRSGSQSFSTSGSDGTDSTADSGEEEVNHQLERWDWESNSDDDDQRQQSLPSRSPDRQDDDIISSDDERDPPPAILRGGPWQAPEYNAPSMLFSCAVLRSLRIGPCRLSPPAVVSLPSLEELLLTRVSDDGEDVQRLISACPRLADLTLEDCDTVTALSLLDCGRLRRLALLCCHKLATVAVDASGELHTLEYRGAVPDQSFLTMHGGGGSSITSCKVDICAEDSSSAEELTKLRDFLQLLAPSTTHLHLHSPRLGSSIEDDAMAPFPHLRHLELRGRLPHDSTASSAVVAVSRILQHAPSLEVLTLVFETGTDWVGYKQGELHDAHHLRYEEHDDVLALPVAAAPAPAMIPCLRNGRVREINLVHYHGGRAQRTLAKFLLRNAPLLEQLYCGFARGPLWIQTKLRDEINGWAMNKPGNRIFS